MCIEVHHWEISWLITVCPKREVVLVFYSMKHSQIVNSSIRKVCFTEGISMFRKVRKTAALQMSVVLQIWELLNPLQSKL